MHHGFIGETEVICIFLSWETGDRLVLAEESVEASHSTISRVPWILHGETSRDSCIPLDHRPKWRLLKNLCASDEHVAGTTACFESKISRLTAENLQFRQAGSPGLAEIATAVGQAISDSDV